jgi:hypothetical protein
MDAGYGFRLDELYLQAIPSSIGKMKSFCGPSDLAKYHFGFIEAIGLLLQYEFEYMYCKKYTDHLLLPIKKTGTLPYSILSLVCKEFKIHVY